jgi:HEPN domain-containing protein
MSDIRLVREWFNYSQNDLTSARHLFNDLYPKQSKIACYLSWQCAEKALKGFLLFKDTEPPRIHNLVELCQEVHGDECPACSKISSMYGIAPYFPCR